jgi:hypothetical protein
MATAGPEHRLFVGHGLHGEVVVAASHYDAMNGLAVAESELGLSSGRDDKMLFCLREVPTGTHVPRWICRYQNAVALEREQTRNQMVEAQLWISQPAPSVMVTVSGPAGGGGRAGTPVPR